MTPEQQAREIMDHYFYPEVEGAETGLEAAIVSALAMRNQEIKRLTRIETRLQNRQWLIGVVRGALNSAIQEHGPINAANQISLEKRLVGFLTGQILRGDGPDHCPRCDALRAQRDALVAALKFAWKFAGKERLAPWVAWTECGESQRQGFHCWGCTGEFISTWRDGWPQPTDATFPHVAGCEYVKMRAALSAGKEER